MEEIRQQENCFNLPLTKPQKGAPGSSDPEDFCAEPIPILTHLATFRETKTQIFDSEDRSKWLRYLLKQLSESDLPDKAFIEQYLRHLYRHMCTAKSVERAYSVIDSFLCYLQQNTSKRSFKEITREELEAFIEHEQDRGLKPSSIRLKIVTLRAFIRFFVEKEELRHDLLSRRIRVKLPEPLPKAINPADMKRFLSVIDNIRDRAMLLLLVRTGMRIGELLRIKITDLNMTDRKIMIYQAPKTGTGRVVYYSADARVALQEWLKHRDTRSELLFYGQRGRRLTYGGARLIFVSNVRKAGLTNKGYTLHCLRHTFASELLNAGMGLECLQKLLGHSSAEVTRRYARLTDKNRKEEYFKALQKIERGEIDGDY